MDLIYTNSEMVDQGILREYELDLAFGADENNLECRIQAGSHCCEAGSILYVDGTEYGGIIDSIESKTDTKEIFYRGRTWHGILNSKVLQPDGGQAYLTLSGEANSVLGALIDRMALTGLFEASSEDSGLTIKNYKMNRYITGYDGILKMLKSVGGKLLLTFHDGKVILSAAKVRDYSQDEEFDADLVPFHAKRNYKGVNHLICLGNGQLEERTVIHLYADTEGNISQEQTQFGLDEVSAIYENTNIETEEELLAEGTNKLEELMAADEISIDFDADSDAYDIGDIIGAVDNITGLMAYTTIAKKIVTIKNGQITVSLSPDTAKAGSSMEIGGGGGSGGGSVVGGVESFNGRTGAVVPAVGDYTSDMVGVHVSATEPTDEGATVWIDTSEEDGNKYYTAEEADAKFVGGVESEEYTGCYYRAVSGVVEWLNPPMLLGVEYRTTERFLGKPVYAKLIDFGALPNAAVKSVSHGISNIDCLLFTGGNAKDVFFPMVSTNNRAIELSAGLTTIYVTTTYDYSGRNAVITMKYTKTTD